LVVVWAKVKGNVLEMFRRFRGFRVSEVLEENLQIGYLAN
jgi:hypothetical protein